MPTAISRFAPPLALMALIYFLSAQPDLDSGLGGWDTVLRKAAHMAEFGLLALLWWRALGRLGPAVAITLAYAAADEFHQTFVEGRHGSPVDWLIDTTGVLLAVLAHRAWTRRRRGGSVGVGGRGDAGMPGVSAEDAGRANSGAIRAAEDKG